MGKKIRDTIHGYIYLTKVEEAVSQHPLFLRLHYVHQTSFTYLTYPNAHSTRYPHSLGVMHVAGEIFSSALRNSKSSDTQDLAKVVRESLRLFHPQFDELSSDPDALLKKVTDEVLKDDLLSEPVYAISGAPRFEPSVSSPGTSVPVNAHVYVPLLLLYQATRLAALLHDVGHPPFSHIVEYALLDVMRDEYKGHEPRGLDIVDEIIRSHDLYTRSAFEDYPHFAKVSLLLCRYILQKEEAGTPFSGIKSSLLDGPIDADRLDYVRRDAHTAGLVPTYDIRRLIDAAFIRKFDGRYEIGYQPNCLSAFENFFIARYDLYRWMIYHHDVARRNLAMQRAIRILVDTTSQLQPRIRSIGKEFGDMAVGEPKGYRRFVDSYLLDKFWIIYELLENGTPGDNSDEPRLKFYLDIVLARRNDALRTLLKRPDNYGQLADMVVAGRCAAQLTDGDKSPENVKRLNGALTERFKETTRQCGGNANVAKVQFGTQVERAIREQLSDDHRPAVNNLNVYAYYMGAFQAGPDKAEADRKPRDRALFFSTPKHPDEKIWVQGVSPTLTMLQEAWAYSPQLLIFYSHPDRDQVVEGSHQHDMLLESVREGLRAFTGIS